MSTGVEVLEQVAMSKPNKSTSLGLAAIGTCGGWTIQILRFENALHIEIEEREFYGVFHTDRDVLARVLTDASERVVLGRLQNLLVELVRDTEYNDRAFIVAGADCGSIQHTIQGQRLAEFLAAAADCAKLYVPD